MNRRALLLVLPSVLAAQTVAEKIESAAAASITARRAVWGVHALNLTTGQVVYARDAERFFVPASNAKLFSTALVMTRLGPNHRYTTTLIGDGELDDAGTLAGNLRLVGGGDPTLSGRTIPYTRVRGNGDAMGPLEAIADQAYMAGLRRVDGHVIGDDSAYLWEPYPPGWSLDDTLWEYGAPVSALTLHDNTVRVEVRPGDQPGHRAQVELRPRSAYFLLEPHVITGADQRVQVQRGGTPRTLTVWGTVRPGDGASIPVAIPDPAHYAAHALREALERRGIRVRGGEAARHRYAWGGTEALESQPEADGYQQSAAVILAVRQSPPLIELLKVVNKVSQNLHAELALREVARVRGAHGSRRTALADMAVFLRRAGIAAGDVHLVDASGLSRLTLATPASFTALLKFMHASRYKDLWMQTLPVGGEDGTLGTRFRGLETGRVLAKTGSLTHVSALSGYLDNARGETIAFSVMVNNASTPPGAVRTFIDTVVKLMAE